MTLQLGDSCLLFLDIEASSLAETGFPIEIGWAWLHGVSGGTLIQPALEWDVDGWDEMAEAIHCIPLSVLRRDGRPARDVAEHLSAMIKAAEAEVVVVSDAPDYDQFWLDRLYEQTPARQNFRLKDFHVLRRECFHGAMLTLAQDAPRAHRAEADAVRLRSDWKDLVELGTLLHRTDPSPH